MTAPGREIELLEMEMEILEAREIKRVSKGDEDTREISAIGREMSASGREIRWRR